MKKTGKFIAAFGAALCLAFQASATQQAPQNETQTPQDDIETLQFINLRTDETMSVQHRRNQPVSSSVNWFMRDFRLGRPANMDPTLFNLLLDMKQEINRQYPDLPVVFHVISAYRAPETNENLRRSGGDQAKKSRHIQGDAMDIRVPGLSAAQLRDIATCLKAGGVGYYGGSENFIHVDTGRVRYWPSRAYLAGLKCPAKLPQAEPI